MSMDVNEALLGLRLLGFHPHLTAGESHRHAWLAWCRGYPEQGGATPAEALTALIAWVDRTQPATTRQLRKDGAP